jgi:hypothetical protein
MTKGMFRLQNITTGSYKIKQKPEATTSERELSLFICQSIPHLPMELR